MARRYRLLASSFFSIATIMAGATSLTSTNGREMFGIEGNLFAIKLVTISTDVLLADEVVKTGPITTAGHTVIRSNFFSSRFFMKSNAAFSAFSLLFSYGVHASSADQSSSV